jgi:hypothetical protein
MSSLEFDGFAEQTNRTRSLLQEFQTVTMIHGEMAAKWIQMAGCQRQWYVRIDKKTVTILKQSADEG